MTSVSAFSILSAVDAELRIPTQARSQRTRAELVEAARLEFAERGYALTTAKSVAARAAVGTGTFYHYFPDKDALLREIAAQRAATLEAQLTSHSVAVELDPLDLGGSLAEVQRRVREDVRIYVGYHSKDRGLHAVISERRLCDAGLDALMTEIEQRGMRRTADALERWGSEADVQAAAFMIFSLLDGAVHNHVLGHPTLTDARFVDALVDAILRIGAPARVWQFLEQSK